MNLLSRIRGERADAALSLEQWAMYNGHSYPVGMQTTLAGSPQQDIENSFVGYVVGVHNRSGTVAAAVFARALLLSQLHFKFRRLADGPQGALYGTQALLPLEVFDAPWTRSRILMRAEQHVSYAGNAYFYRPLGGRVRLLNPDSVRLIIASETDPDSPAHQLDGELVAYLHYPDPSNRSEFQVLAPDDVVQWAPEPHPLNPWIGQSWVTSIMAEVLGDDQLSEHQRKFYGNAATPNLIVKVPKVEDEALKRFRRQFQDTNAGEENAGKTLILTEGADVQVVGSQLAQLELKDTQGGHESRIAARARVPASILGIREGMQGSALTTGNYSAARRMWSDGWFAPTSDGLAETLAGIVDVPADSELTHDPSRVLFLQEDRKDEADIAQSEAATVKAYVDAGFDPPSVIEAVRSGDISKLRHTGLYSVQLQPAGTDLTGATP